MPKKPLIPFLESLVGFPEIPKMPFLEALGIPTGRSSNKGLLGALGNPKDFKMGRSLGLLVFPVCNPWGFQKGIERGPRASKTRRPTRGRGLTVPSGQGHDQATVNRSPLHQSSPIFAGNLVGKIEKIGGVGCGSLGTVLEAAGKAC